LAYLRVVSVSGLSEGVTVRISALARMQCF
jgi:hypothetical protein